MIVRRRVSERADPKLGKQRRMIRQHADIAVLGGNLRANRLLAREQPLGRGNLDIERVRH